MKLCTVIQVLITLLFFALTESSRCNAGGDGFGVIKQDAKLNFTDTPIEDVCKEIALVYDVSVFLEKGIDVSVSSDGTHSKLGVDLGRMLKPHGLHLHADSMGVFIKRKPTPYNVTQLAGDVELELAIPLGRERRYHSDNGVRWAQGDSEIVVLWNKRDKSLKQIAEAQAGPDQPTLVTIRKGDYLVKRSQIPPGRSFNREKRKMEDREMVSDTIYFINGDYLYSVSHNYPKAAANAGATLSKRLLQTIRWQDVSKFKRFGR